MWRASAGDRFRRNQCLQNAVCRRVDLRALAVMIFGQWKPVNIGLAALLFGLFRALSNVYTGFDVLVALKLPSTLYNMFPYIISLIVLVFVSKNSRAPKAEGIPYDKGQR